MMVHISTDQLITPLRFERKIAVCHSREGGNPETGRLNCTGFPPSREWLKVG